jgi:hypothetical protein
MASIRGIVTGSLGERVWNATVVLRPLDGQGRSVRFGLANGNGEFQIDNVAVGRYVVTATHRFYIMFATEMDITRDEVITIPLSPNLSVKRTY